jgi:hypothetical protein
MSLMPHAYGPASRSRSAHERVLKAIVEAGDLPDERETCTLIDTLSLAFNHSICNQLSAPTRNASTPKNHKPQLYKLSRERTYLIQL